LQYGRLGGGGEGSWDNKPNVWLLNTVSGELKQLTFGIDVAKGDCTPDGKWLLYAEGAASNGVGRIFKVSTAEELPSNWPAEPVFSSGFSGWQTDHLWEDGGTGADTTSKLVVQRLEDGAIEKQIEMIAPFDDWHALG
jgi:Tol biopolymer transport system component